MFGMNWDKHTRTVFVVGAAVGALAVQGLAKGIMLKDRIVEEVSDIREKAEDICADAKAAAQGACESDDHSEEPAVEA